MVAKIANIGVWELDLQEKSLIWDEAMYLIYGLKDRQIGNLWRTFIDSIHPEDRQRVIADCERAALGEHATFEADFRIVRPDGESRFIKSYSVTQFDKFGRPARQVGVNWDVTILHETERQLKDSNDRIKLATTAANIGIWELDIIRDVVKWGDMVHNIHDPSKDTLSKVTESWIRALHPEDKSRILDEADRAMRGELPCFDLTYRMVRPDGSIRHIREYGTMQYDAFGNPVRMLGANWDITELKETERKLLERTKESEAAAQAKSQFLANMSHEIRTPLTSIIGYCETILDQSLSASERREAAVSAFRSARHLLGVINNILDISRLEAGKANIEITRTNLFDVISELVSINRGKIEEKRLGINVQYRFPVPRYINTDHTALRQILFNLIDNALKFTESGSVTICTSFNKQQSTVSISIADTGIGVTPDQCKRLFQVFSQGDSSTTRRFGGSGLGLAISKHLATLLGGDIALENNPGSGSIFTLTVPCREIGEGDITYADQAAAESSLFEIPPVDSSKLPKFSGKVLIVEDSPEIQRYIQFLLSRMGLAVTTVADGEQAVEAVRADKFDLIVMDMHLPGIDGQSATKMIRQRDVDIPIMALTADIRSEHVASCMDAGCNAFLPKPFSRAELVEKLSTFLVPGSDECVESQNAPYDYESDRRRFVESFIEQVEQLDSACAASQYELLSKNSHKLAGAAAFAYPAVYEPLIGLNDAARQCDAEQCLRSLARIKQIHLGNVGADTNSENT